MGIGKVVQLKVILLILIKMTSLHFFNCHEEINTSRAMPLK